MKDKVRKLLREKEWTFDEISKVHILVKNLANQMYDGLDSKAKLKLIWHYEIDTEAMQNEGNYTIEFGHLFSTLVLDELEEQVAEIINSELTNAKINFNKGNKNENTKSKISKRSLGGKPHKERTPDETRDSKQ